VKIISEMYLWTRKSPLNFGSHLERTRSGSRPDPPIFCGSTGSGGQLTPLLPPKNTVNPTCNMYKACFFCAFGSLSCIINAIHCVHHAHIKLLLTYPTLTEHSRVLLLAFHYAFGKGSCDLLLKFWDPLHISERAKLETSNLACI